MATEALRLARGRSVASGVVELPSFPWAFVYHFDYRPPQNQYRSSATKNLTSASSRAFANKSGCL